MLADAAVIFPLLFHHTTDTITGAGGGVSLCRGLEMECDLSAYAGLDPVYLDGIAGVLNLGGNVMICYFRWEPRPGSGILERAPALCAVRPMSSIAPGGSIIGRLAGMMGPPTGPIELVH